MAVPWNGAAGSIGAGCTIGATAIDVGFVAVLKSIAAAGAGAHATRTNTALTIAIYRAGCIGGTRKTIAAAAVHIGLTIIEDRVIAIHTTAWGTVRPAAIHRNFIAILDTVAAAIRDADTQVADCAAAAVISAGTIARAAAGNTTAPAVDTFFVAVLNAVRATINAYLHTLADFTDLTGGARTFCRRIVAFACRGNLSGGAPRKEQQANNQQDRGRGKFERSQA